MDSVNCVLYRKGMKKPAWKDSSAIIFFFQNSFKKGFDWLPGHVILFAKRIFINFTGLKKDYGR